MSIYCEAKRSWDSKSRIERLQSVTELVNDVLMDEAAPAVEIEAVPDLLNDKGQPTQGLYLDGKVMIDQHHLDHGSFEDVANTAFHEARHAVNDWNDWPDESDLDGEPFGPGDYWTEEGIYIDQKGSLRDLLGDATPLTDEEIDQLKHMEETDAQDFADERLDGEKEKCDEEPGPESSSENSLPKGDWVLPDEETTFA